MYTDKNKYLNLLTKILLNEASAKEEKELTKWKNEDRENEAFIEEITKVWNLSGNYAENLLVDTTPAWNKFESKLNQTSSKKTQGSNVRTLLFNWKAAAIFIGLTAIGVWWSIQNSNKASVSEIKMAQIMTGAKEQREIMLPDSSVVLLNENSMLAYAKDFKTRKVTLKGEAFFDVTKQVGKSFEITTAATKTTVLGTSFNVRAYEEQDVEVVVVTGKVAVEELDEEKESVLLLPNERVVYRMASKAMEKEIVSEMNSIAWKTNELNFDSISLGVIIKELKHYFDVEVEGNEKILNCSYTGSFERFNLDEAFNAIAFTYNLEVKKVNKKYILIGQGCE